MLDNAWSIAVTLVKFEGIDPQPTGATQIADGYSGLHWDNFYALDTRPASYANTGYRHGTVSGTSVGFNGSGLDATFSADVTFSLKSGYFTGVFSDYPITLTAFLGGTEVGHKTFNVINTLPTHVKFGHRFDHIDAVTVSTGSAPSSQVAIDNLRIQFDAPTADEFVPPPDGGAAPPESAFQPVVDLDLLGIAVGALDNPTDTWMFC
jgi:hypothetical protein